MFDAPDTFDITRNGELRWLRSIFISGIKSMPVAFDVADG